MKESQPRCRLAYANSSSTYGLTDDYLWVQSAGTEQSLRLLMGLEAGSHLLSLVLYSKGVQSTSDRKTNFELSPLTIMLLFQPTF